MSRPKAYASAFDDGLYLVLDETNECGLTGKKMVRYALIKHSRKIMVLPYDVFYGEVELPDGRTVKRFKVHDFSVRLNEINARAQRAKDNQQVKQ